MTVTWKYMKGIFTLKCNLLGLTLPHCQKKISHSYFSFWISCFDIRVKQTSQSFGHANTFVDVTLASREFLKDVPHFQENNSLSFEANN